MQYRHAARGNYEDLAAGRVLRGAAGATNFPVRLASELFQRALTIRGGTGRVRLWDPCCGSGYLVATLGFMHASRIRQIEASEIDAEILRTATQNLDLLRPGGLSRRIAELGELYAAHGKRSHAEAIESARRLSRKRAVVDSHVFQADALVESELRKGLGNACADILIADLPYGRMKAWQGRGGEEEGAAGMLGAVHGLLAPEAVVVLVVAKRTPVAVAGYERVERVRVGKREAHVLVRV